MSESLFGVCPHFTFAKILSGKWMLPILKWIGIKERVRFGELTRLMPEITKASLTRDLRLLEENGFITREVMEVSPLKVEYSLTPIGLSFMEVIEKLDEWGNAYVAHMEDKGTPIIPCPWPQPAEAEAVME